MRAFVHDLAYGARIVRHRPGYALVIVVTLALAIGANTVTFSFTNVLLLRPLPVHDQKTLGFVFSVNPQRGVERGTSSIPDLLDYRQSLTSFSSIAGTRPGNATMTGRGDAQMLSANRVTANLFQTWGLRTAAGRGFAEGEDLPGAPAVVVLSHRFWQRQFGGDPGIVGEAMMLDGAPATIVGVLSPDIEIGNLSLLDVWLPLALDPDLPRDERTVRVSARLRPGVPFEQATAEMSAVAQRLQQDHPATNAGWAARLAPTSEAMTGSDTWIVLGLLMLVVCFVLLIACANIANLVLARATGRRREMAVRAALGASRTTMVRQLLTESLLVGLLGGGVGLAVAYGGLAVIKAAAYEPFFELVVIDRNVLLFTAALSLLTPLLFSLVPALHASGAGVNEMLKEGGSRVGGGRRGRRSRAALVVSQLALAMTLLIVSTLLVRTMVAINRVDWGFEPAGVLTMRVEAPAWRYETDSAVRDYFDRVIARLGAMPGVHAVAAVDRLPVLGGESTVALAVDGFAPSRPDDRPWAVATTATSQFFAAAGIPILAGRGFAPGDAAAAPQVAVVSQEMARRYWGDARRALGGRVSIDRETRGWLTVIGVAADLRRADLKGTNPQIYTSADQVPQRAMTLMARAENPDALLGAARTELRAQDPDVPVSQLRTAEEAFDDEMSSSRILTGMFVSFAVLALALAASGLYGVISYSVSQRVQEIGIRMALGAVPTDIRRLVIRQTLVLLGTGCIIGLAGGAAVARLTSRLLYDVSASDPSTYFGVAAVLCLVALLATYAPVRRATRVDPLVALRAE
ncbi:MAG TPA: ABC transporter permease [Vicinamibacterales bacterium]|nr:ABC transporter permease [Vicinamibacterales bacterium]